MKPLTNKKIMKSLTKSKKYVMYLKKSFVMIKIKKVNMNFIIK